jgi:hypothetical protein
MWHHEFNTNEMDCYILLGQTQCAVCENDKDGRTMEQAARGHQELSMQRII